MKKKSAFTLFVVLAIVLQQAVAAQDDRQRKGGPSGSGSGLGNYEKPPAANDIPDHPFDIVLGRPTDSSVEVRVLQNASGNGYISYRMKGEEEWKKCDRVAVEKGKPIGIVIEGLKKNSRYEYQWSFQRDPNGQAELSETFEFQTQREPGHGFVFSVTADSHLDENSSGEVYTQTLKNALASQPDFHFELGDTFMTGKYVKPEYSYGQYLAQRYYLSHLCSSAPLFFVMGNHDGESVGRGPINWASTTRKSLFPNPSPNDFYTGNKAEEAGIGYPEDYYAWTWGDAQFIVLDPYRYTISRRRGGGGQGGPGGQRGRGGQKAPRGQLGPTDQQGQPSPPARQGQGEGGRGQQRDRAGNQNGPNAQGVPEAGTIGEDSSWHWTLGEEQYKWLQMELKKPAKYRFVFIHHLVGGAIQNQRGGVEVAKLWEWGGHNEKGEYEFDQHRPKWDKPIHQLFVDAGVSVVFHGHDHFFAKQDLDGIVYQEVPQPSHARAGNTRTAAEYGYLSGEIQASSGYVRVKIEEDSCRIDYVRTYPSSDRNSKRNGEVTFSYYVKPSSNSK